MSSSFVRRFFAATALVPAAVVLAACASDAAEKYPAEDLQPSGDLVVDLNALLGDEEMQTFGYYRELNIQRFLSNPPYRPARRSFLATYFSNGRSLAGAIADLSAKYKISPVLLLARAEMAGALVSRSAYPVEAPWTVEYAFGCGCTSVANCSASSLGLDRQLECYAAAFRKEADRAATGATSTGWTPNVSKQTLDGVTVTPENATAAAFYTLDPVAGKDGKSGAGLFLNIYNLYLGSAALTEARNRPIFAYPGETCRSATDCDTAIIAAPACLPLGALKICGSVCSGTQACVGGLTCVVQDPTDKTGVCLEPCDFQTDCGQSRTCQLVYSFPASGQPERKPVCFLGG